jgi:hypothetical protein
MCVPSCFDFITLSSGTVYLFNAYNYKAGVVLIMVDENINIIKQWRGARVVERGGLENRCGGNSTGGSNPSPSVSSITVH